MISPLFSSVSRYPPPSSLLDIEDDIQRFRRCRRGHYEGTGRRGSRGAHGGPSCGPGGPRGPCGAHGRPGGPGGLRFLIRALVTIIDILALFLALCGRFVVALFHRLVATGCLVHLVLAPPHFLPATLAGRLPAEVKDLAPHSGTEQGHVGLVTGGRGVVHHIGVGGVQPVGGLAGPGAPPPPPLAIALVLPHVPALLPPVVGALVLVPSLALHLLAAHTITLVLHAAACSPGPHSRTRLSSGDVAGDLFIATSTSGSSPR